MTTPISSTTAVPNPAANTNSSADTNGSTDGILNFTQNFNTFLTLLTTQMKNQDPLNPMDSNQFTQQLVEFSQVEQQIKTNSQLSTMISNQAGSEALSAQSMVGQTIQYSGSQAVLQNGQAQFSYTLPSNASAVSVSIQDANGSTIFSGSGQTTAGTYNFTWNGQNNAGQQQPDGGVYTINVQAMDSNGKPITATTTATGVVTGVSVENNVATFNVSGVQVPMNQLIGIVQPSSTSA
ncbi:MAG TPA: flagellar hook capping FlgD N-terminal domain-containing protein [Stellaceae bacterium]|nr:flagellar hook capping FlgD N-terminal domain-containing protein [Stellaceae bacterium]